MLCSGPRGSQLMRFRAADIEEAGFSARLYLAQRLGFDRVELGPLKNRRAQGGETPILARPPRQNHERIRVLPLWSSISRLTEAALIIVAESCRSGWRYNEALCVIRLFFLSLSLSPEKTLWSHNEKIRFA